MRTKSLVAAAAVIAAGVASSMAQSNVYSLNVVGYVNRAIPAAAFAMVSNPLQATNNALSTIFPVAPDGTSVFTWNEGAQDLDAVVPTYFTGVGWTPDITIAPGQGFFALGGDNFTNTFVGEVRQGALATAIGGNAGFSAIGSQVPQGGSLTTNILAGYIPSDGDSVFTWNEGAQDLDAVVPTFFTGVGWTPDINLNVADGFFLLRVDPGVTWTRNFTVQ